LRQKKRKSEATDQEEPRRKRGRPRLSEQRRLEAEKEAERKAAGEPLAATGTKETVEEESSKMTTRRTARRSAVVKTDPVTLAKSVSTKPTSKKQQKQAEVQEDETVVGANDKTTTSNHETLPHTPGLSNPSSATTTRKQPATVAKAPSQVVSSTTKDTSDGTKDADLLILDAGKTKSAPKRSKSKKSLTIKSNRNIGALTNGTSKAPAKQIVEPPPSALVEPTQAPTSHLINGTAPSSSTNSAAAPHASAKVEYFARVHTWIGVQEVPLARNKLTEDAEIVQKYAEWMEAEGVQIPYLSFKSIFGFAKKR
jgi:hypothetical protein